MKVTVNKLFFKAVIALCMVLVMSLNSGCASKQTPLPTPEQVDLESFMGRWYVHGYTPILVDKEAHNAIEHYRMDADEKIQTTYQFRDGGFDGELKTYTPVGWVHDETTNAEWRMQFIWPFRAEYVILHLDQDYTETVIAHPNRKYAWIMHRSKQVSEADYKRLIGKLETVGFDPTVVQRLPQDWSQEAERLQKLEAEGL
jgi:apolipoprotein D and lipocalin family protein